MVNFDATPEELNAASRIAKAAHAEFGLPVMNTVMDLTACNANGCPIKLEEMAEHLDNGRFYFDVMHDVTGIRQHINRQTGKLEGCFMPRFAKVEENEEA